MRVYVDANIYLNFFERSNDGITSLDSFKEYVDTGKINLIFPQITQDEFFRNLPSIKQRYLKIIASALTTLKTAHGSVDYLGFGRAATTKAAIEDLKKSTLEELKVMQEKYPSDCDNIVTNTIIPLVKKSLRPDETSELFERAKRRRLLGNPPGKSDAKLHIGDEFTWELILENYTDDDLIIISNDGDWLNLDTKGSKGISSFLKAEWERKTTKTIRAVNTIGEFINIYLKPPKNKKVTKEEIAKEKKTLIPPDEIDLFNVEHSPGIYTSALQAISGNAAYIDNSGLVQLRPATPWTCPMCKNYNAGESTTCLRCGYLKSLQTWI